MEAKQGKPGNAIKQNKLKLEKRKEKSQTRKQDNLGKTGNRTTARKIRQQERKMKKLKTETNLKLEVGK